MMEDKNREAERQEPKIDYLGIAMQDGLRIGLVFCIQACAMLLYRWGVISSLLSLAGFVAVPVFLYRLGRKYQYDLMQGQGPYLQVTGFLIRSYGFGVLIGTVAFFAVFTLLYRDAHFLSMLSNSFELAEEMIAQMGGDTAVLEVMKGATPRSITLQILVNMSFFGLIYIYLMALFLRRRKAE